ncbi:hypothetical protein [Ferrovum myxofaciens]|uniref:hypothetical protein n=1 Tax=Ferrovum myxofaciens TaxID=416213 RepID=UPI0023565353|nr:hypothetical protein [Ferrovum myxofaciens]MBU6994262.1 hypothetical protein [Ferrovum myxofaciens]
MSQSEEEYAEKLSGKIQRRWLTAYSGLMVWRAASKRCDERFADRVKLFQWWGKQLAAAQRGATVIPLKNKVA